MRNVAHSNFETFLNERVVLNINGIYQYQSKAEYFSIGSALGYFLPAQNDILLTAGLWYWSANAIIPYVGVAWGDYQFGLSYDATTSKLKQATNRPNTYEVSLIVRGRSKPTYIIPCPWK